MCPGTGPRAHVLRSKTPSTTSHAMIAHPERARSRDQEGEVLPSPKEGLAKKGPSMVVFQTTLSPRSSGGAGKPSPRGCATKQVRHADSWGCEAIKYEVHSKYTKAGEQNL